MKPIPLNAFLFVTIGLSAVLIGVAVLFFITNNEVNTINPLTFNPMCMVTNCSNEKEPTFQEVEDGKYVTLNFCTINSPKKEFTEALQACADSAGSERTFFKATATGQTESRIDRYHKWYVNTYVPSCGFGWNTSPLEDVDTDEVLPLITACKNA